MRTVDAKYLAAQGFDEKWNALHVEAAARLRVRVAQHEAPSPTWHPVQDICLVYRIPNPYKSASGIVLPEAYAQAHDSVLNHGLLISAGPEALDVLASHGILIGDYVKFARFAGEEEDAKRAQEAIARIAATGGTEADAWNLIDKERQRKKLLELQVPFIHGSMDLLERLGGPSQSMEKVRVRLPNGAVEHQIIPV